MNEIQITIPAEVLTATVKVLGSYQARLEREIKVLKDPAQVEAHRKLIEIVRRLLAFYAEQLGKWYKHDGRKEDANATDTAK